MDAFDRRSLLSHLQAQAVAMTQPVIVFLAAVATNTGSSLTHVLQNPHLPLIKSDSTSMFELLEGSRLPDEAIVMLLAKIIKEDPSTVAPMPQQGSSSSSTSTPRKQPPSPDASSTAPQSPVSSAEDTFVPIKSNVRISGHIGEAIDILNTNIELIGIPARVGPGGAPVGAAGQAGNNNNNGGGLAEMANVFANVASRLNGVQWTWNAQLENSALALVRPEVTAIINLAYQDVRAISAVHAVVAHDHESARRQPFCIDGGWRIECIARRNPVPSLDAQRA